VTSRRDLDITTREQLLALPPVVGIQTAGRAWGLSRSRVYEAHARDALPFPVVPVAGRLKVTRASLLISLGIDPAAEPATQAPAPRRTTSDMDEASSAEELATVTADDRNGPGHHEPASQIRAV
jgi:hypothetical protein